MKRFRSKKSDHSADEATAHHSNAKTDQQHGTKAIAKTVSLLLLAPLVALFITAFVFHSYEVYGPSMQNTLHNGDRLIVLKAPRTWAKLWQRQFMPIRGQIVVFNRPGYLNGLDGDNKQLIKRVVALPGERVVISDGILKVYNDENPEGFEPDEVVNDGVVSGITDGSVDLVVPEGEVFVVGDNRTNSLDSRSFGPINSNSIVGTAVYRMFPLGSMRGL